MRQLEDITAIKRWLARAKKNKLKTLLYIALAISIIDFVWPFVFTGAKQLASPDTQKSAAEFEQKLQKYKLEIAARKAHEMGLPVLDGVTEYRRFQLLNGSKIRKNKTKNITVLRGLPSSGVTVDGFVFQGNFYFFSKKDNQIYLIIQE